MVSFYRLNCAHESIKVTTIATQLLMLQLRDMKKDKTFITTMNALNICAAADFKKVANALIGLQVGAVEVNMI